MILSQTLSVFPLIALALALSTAALAVAGRRFCSLVVRMRYVLLALAVIYAFATPGEALIDALGRQSPTRAGVITGGLQLLRLAIALAGLSLVLSTTERSEFLSGVVWLTRPLRLFGVDITRLAVRLSLTLSYAEDTAKLRFRDLLQELRSGDFDHRQQAVITIPSHRLGTSDVVVLAAMVCLVLLASL